MIGLVSSSSMLSLHLLYNKSEKNTGIVVVNLVAQNTIDQMA